MSEVWKPTTRGGYQLRNVWQRDARWRGEVCLRADGPRRGHPEDWQAESWYPDGTYYGRKPKSELDLVAINEGGAIMSNPKWEVGPVRLADGTDAWIFFVQPESKHQRYIGKVKDSNGKWCAMHWCDSGRVPYTTTGHAKSLAPPPKKTVRVRCWVNVDASGGLSCFLFREDADRLASVNRIACIEIDREVEEGEGL